MSETIVLDPDVMTGGSRPELVLSDDGTAPIQIRQEGVNWGDAEIEAVMAKQVVGALPVDFEIPNRIISMKVKIKATDDVTFAEARSALQAKVAAIQAGVTGWISRDMPGVGTVYADLVNAKLSLPGDWMQAHRDVQVDAELSFEAIPDFYEAEWEEAEVTDVESGDSHWRGVIEHVGGDFPKGNRCKVIVEGDADRDQRGALIAFRHHHYSDAPTAAAFLQAQDLDPLDLATVVTLAGASGGASNNAVRHNNLGTSWTPVLGLRLAGGDYLTHAGTVRLIARVYSTSPTPPEIRCVFDVGDLLNPSELPPAAIPGANNFYAVDLGALRLDPVLSGSHRWLGQIQARGAAGGENVTIDMVDLWPTDEHYAKVTAPLVLTEGLVDYAARDEFNQSGGALASKTAPVGGNWDGEGDAVDVAVDFTSHRAIRSEVNDASIDQGGRRSILDGVSLDAAVVQVTFEHSAIPSTPGATATGVIARYTNSTHYLMAAVLPASTSEGTPDPSTGLRIWKMNTVLDTVARRRLGGPLLPGVRYTLRVAVDPHGLVAVWLRPAVSIGSAGTPDLIAVDADFAQGGALESGTVGFYDAKTLSGASERRYDGFAAWAPDPDAVIFAGRTLETGTSSATRQSPDGLSSGPLVPVGSQPRLPQGDAVEVLAATSRGDLDRLPDSGRDDVGLQILYRRSWLTVPGG
jgi:hypothetical protein